MRSSKPTRRSKAAVSALALQSRILSDTAVWPQIPSVNASRRELAIGVNCRTGRLNDAIL
jgi:hypothetical protein